MKNVSSDFEQYGGSYLISEKNKARYIDGQDYIGRPDGQFITPSNQMDDMLNKYPDNPREWERQLGLNEGSLGNEKIRRVDVYTPQDYEPRLPTSDLSGANEKFLEGQGKVPGGQDECVINQFPNPENNPNVGRISEIPLGQSRTNDSSSEQARDKSQSGKVADGGGARAPDVESASPEQKSGERGSIPSESTNGSQNNKPTTRGEKPQEAPKNTSSTQPSQRGTRPSATGNENSKAPTSSSSHPSDKILASNNSAKAANGTSNVASEKTAQSATSKAGGMGV